MRDTEALLTEILQNRTIKLKSELNGQRSGTLNTMHRRAYGVLITDFKKGFQRGTSIPRLRTPGICPSWLEVCNNVKWQMYYRLNRLQAHSCPPPAFTFLQIWSCTCHLSQNSQRAHPHPTSCWTITKFKCCDNTERVVILIVVMIVRSSQKRCKQVHAALGIEQRTGGPRTTGVLRVCTDTASASSRLGPRFEPCPAVKVVKTRCPFSISFSRFLFQLYIGGRICRLITKSRVRPGEI